MELPTDWPQAECLGTDQIVFFPSPTYYEGSPSWTELVSIARSMCRVCVVRADCLEYAMETNQEDGIWGGLTPKERRRLRKRSA